MNVKKLIGVTGAAILTLTALSGCMRVDADLYIGADGQPQSATIDLAVNKSAMASMASGFGMMDEQTATETPTLEQFKESFTEQSNGLPQEECEFTETDSEFVAHCELTGEQYLNQESMDAAGISVNDGVITVEIETEKQDPMAISMGLQSTVRYHFEGDVISVEGAGSSIAENDSTVAVVNQMQTDGSVIVIKASGEKSDAGVLLLLVGIVVGLLVLGGAFLILSSRKAKTEDAVSNQPDSADKNEVVENETQSDN